MSFRSIEKTVLTRVLFPATLLSILIAASSTWAAGPGDPPGRWWFGVDLGAGQLQRSAPGFAESKVRFYASIEGGVAVTRQLLFGVEGSGWLLEPSQYGTSCALWLEPPGCWDPTTGAAISPLFVTARIYPSKMSTFHFRVGGGLVNAWNNPTGTSNWGTGWEAGVGYDVRLQGRHHLTPFVLYSHGRAADLDISAVTFGAGYTWR